jgi:hypothetical protein
LLTSHELDKILNKFIDNHIRLSQKDIAASAKSREWVLDRLKSKIDNRDESPSLYKDEPFVKFGSYFTGLKVSNVDEYDILVTIDSNSGVFYKPANNSYGTGLGSAYPNHKYDQRFKKSDNSGVSPTKIMNWLKGLLEEIAESYGGEAPEKDGQAITLKIKSKDIKIDFVPAGIFKRNSDNSVFYNIPSGGKDNSWILTNPKLDSERIKRLSSLKSDFKNIVRLEKYIRDQYSMKISSCAIQTNACDHAEELFWYSGTFENLVSVLRSLKKSLDLKILLDPYDGETNLLEGVDNLPYYSDRIDKIITNFEELEYETSTDSAYNKLCSILSNGNIAEVAKTMTKSQELLARINILKQQGYFDSRGLN